MVNKIVKIIFLVILIISTLVIDTYGKYSYKFNIKAFSLTRDNSEIIYDVKKSISDTEYTNKNVLLTINLNKPVDKIDGFELSEDGKKLTRVVEKNESQTITVEDISGNKKDISYSVNNIDKIPPEIIGVEDGEIYNTDKKITYKDNLGIKDIFVDKYGDLDIMCYDEYYDTRFFKGTCVNSNWIYVEARSHPKNTKYYQYYLDGILLAKTEEKIYNYKGLDSGTYYNIKIEAVDKNGNVLEKVERTIKTKYFIEIQSVKYGNIFDVTLRGLDSRVTKVVAVGYTNPGNKKILYPMINSDKTVSAVFSVKDITGNLNEGYYYFDLQLFNGNTVLETVHCNVIFNQEYKRVEEKIDPYNLNSNGNYQIIATDLVGNTTEKCVTIQK